jgi:hypothetical protein
MRRRRKSIRPQRAHENFSQLCQFLASERCESAAFHVCNLFMREEKFSRKAKPITAISVELGISFDVFRIRRQWMRAENEFGIRVPAFGGRVPWFIKTVRGDCR